jgi:DNA repair exonuclease SbcCD ATPase subunit
MGSPEENERNVISIPNLNLPGTWTKENSERLQVAGQELKRYETTSSQIKGLATKARRNHYHFEVLAATNDFQLAAAKLLHALQQSDVADKAKQKSGMKEVRASLDYFDKAWENLQSVYGKTRFFGYPPGHVRPQYLNHWPDRPDFAEQREDLSFLIMPEQKYHKMVRDWLQANGG